MTTPARFLFASSLALAAPLATGCDSESTESAMDYHAVGHVDIAAARSAPWVQSALGTHAIDLPAELGACASLVSAATSVTAGVGADAYEVYVSGSFDSDDADACADLIEKKAAEHRSKRKGSKPKPKPNAVLLDKDLFAIYGGALAPSRARMESLLASDPSPSGSPIWAVAQDHGTKHDPIAAVQAWADTSKGLTAHVDVQFDSEAQATELYGKAMLGLTAMQLSGEASELAKTVSLSSRGDTLTADLHAPPKLLHKLIDAKQAKVKATVDGGTGKEHGSLSITLGTD